MICGWRSNLTIIWALKAVAVLQCESDAVVTVSTMYECLQLVELMSLSPPLLGKFTLHFAERSVAKPFCCCVLLRYPCLFYIDLF